MRLVRVLLALHFLSLLSAPALARPGGSTCNGLIIKWTGQRVVDDRKIRWSSARTDGFLADLRADRLSEGDLKEYFAPTNDFADGSGYLLPDASVDLFRFDPRVLADDRAASLLEALLESRGPDGKRAAINLSRFIERQPAGFAEGDDRGGRAALALFRLTVRLYPTLAVSSRAHRAPGPRVGEIMLTPNIIAMDRK